MRDDHRLALKKVKQQILSFCLRLRRKYYRMVLKNNKKANVAKTAVARELACFIWGMMTDNYA